MFKNNLVRITLFIFVFSISLAYLLVEQSIASQNASETKNLIVNARQITFDGPKSGEGYFSADGQKMIFQSERDPQNPFYQMFMMDLNTGLVERVSVGHGKTTCGWIHPSQKKIMWSSTHLHPNITSKVKAEFEERAKPIKGRYSWSFDEYYDIFESNLKGAQLKRLTKEKGYDAEGSYSPDGKSIVFASNRTAYNRKLNADELKKFQQDPSYFMEIYIMNSDGSNVRRLTETPGYDGGPFFSADGKKITWRRFSESGASAEIMTMNVDGRNQKQITRLNSMSWAPFFHPSGDYIIFASTVGGYSNFELFIVDTEGQREPIRVTYADGFDGLASFSPQGDQITWSHRNEKGESQIYIGQWDDQLARKLLNIKNSSHIDSLLQTNFQPSVRKEDTRQIVDYLASEKFKGRFTGSEEESQYTQEIGQLFRKWGLSPVIDKKFIQEFEFVSDVSVGPNNLASFQGRLNRDLKLGEDYQLVSYSKTGDFKPAPLVFAGFGIKAPASGQFPGFDSYKGIDINGKWVVILDDMPKPGLQEFSKHSYLLAFSRLQHKITVAKNLGAFGVIVVSDSAISDLKFSGRLSESQLPILKISKETFDSLLKNAIKSDPTFDSSLNDLTKVVRKYSTYDHVSGFDFQSQYLTTKIDLNFKKAQGRNIIAGLNLNSKNPALIIGAHLDHLGVGLTGSSLATNEMKSKIHFGADDNASGVAGVLELAHYYSQKNELNKLKRPILFALWSGEELGTLGSLHFTQNLKKNKLKVMANLNMDMIGRLRESLHIQGVGSASKFKALAELATLKTGLSLNLTHDPYLPTDSMSFYVSGVPAITFFTGAHAEYHTPLDIPETLNYDGLVKVLDVVKIFSDEIAQKTESNIIYEKVEGNSGQKLEGRSFRIFLGTIPDYSQEGVKGVKISGVAKNSPAEKAGLKSGDIIVEFNNLKIENIYDFVYTLQSVQPDQKTKIIIERNQNTETLHIVPVLKE